MMKSVQLHNCFFSSDVMNDNVTANNERFLP